MQHLTSAYVNPALQNYWISSIEALLRAINPVLVLVHLSQQRIIDCIVHPICTCVGQSEPSTVVLGFDIQEVCVCQRCPLRLAQCSRGSTRQSRCT
jgi:hypothetical protein